MDGRTCDVCGMMAEVHLTEIKGGKKKALHLCAEHARQAGMPDAPLVVSLADWVQRQSDPQAATSEVLGNLRGTANFIRRYGRRPASEGEMKEGMALRPGQFPAADIKSASLRRLLERLEAQIAFCETHGRLPQTPDEMPPMSPNAD